MKARFASRGADNPEAGEEPDRVLSALGPSTSPGGWWGLTSMPLPIGHRILDEHVAVHGLGFHATSVKAARDFAYTVLSDWELSELNDLFSEVRLVVSELVTNACRHAVPDTAGDVAEWSIQLGLVRDSTCLTCMAFDPSQRVPKFNDRSGFDEGGRGLHLIESFSSDWGWHLIEGQGKVVWAHLALTDRS